MTASQIEAEFRMSDEFWEKVEPLLPKFPRSSKGGRPRLNWRHVLDGIFYVLRTGCQWKAVPPEFGSGSSLHRYFQLLVRESVFERIYPLAVEEFGELKGMNRSWRTTQGVQALVGSGTQRA
ncbi:MAG TPA: transposase [Planctomycetaceae bacterium]|nr:transposase [Planctomycetaceae bacterium]HIQ22437.1 transposase [Planctomycetota bacterium]